MTNIKEILRRGFGLVGICLLVGVINAQAATLTVTTTADAGKINAQAATLTVTTTADAGTGSLRQAIIDATANAAANIVIFDIPTTDIGFDAEENRFTISLLSPLPDLPLAPLTIDNNQTQGMTVKGDNTFRIFTLVNSAVVTINNLTISNGFSDELGGGIFMGNSSTLNLSRSTVSNNTATDGGGIYVNDSGTLNIDNSTVSGNQAGSNGGGIYINNSGTLNLDTSTISGNTASNDGGGIATGTSGTINATSNTIDGNSSIGNGGGIYNIATLTLTNNTVSGNTAGKGGGIYNNFTATLNNNIVALNAALDGNDLLGRGSLGVPFTGTYNLIGNADGSEGLWGATNQPGSTISPIDPLLGPLQNNGGATFTRNLLGGSMAIDMGNSPVILTDQRGQLRPYDNPSIPNEGNGADIGAFEAQLAAPTSVGVLIGGRVLVSSGEKIGVSGATVYLTDLNGNVRTTRTNPFGYYQFEDVPSVETYLVNVLHKRYAFDAQVVTASGDMIDLNFVALQLRTK